jgi:hypothetical protein
MTTTTDQQNRARAAANMLRMCCRKALVRLDATEADVRTVANQLRQTAELAEKALDSSDRPLFGQELSER